jgi:hypothetical protein
MECHSESERVRVRRGEGVEGARLQREADLLQRARHPGVEELQAVSADGESVEVVTSWVAGIPPGQAVRSVDHAAGVIAVLATTVADLHEIGVAHGGISDERVIVGRDGRPILVGFDQAVAIDGPPRRWSSAPVATADVRAVGALLDELLRAVGATPRPRGRRWQPRRTDRRHGDSTAALFGLAERAGSRVTLSARALADAVLGEASTACLPVAGSDLRTPAPPVPLSPTTGDWRGRVAALADRVGEHWRAASIGGLVTLAAFGIAIVPLACQHRSRPVGTGRRPAKGVIAPDGLASLADGVLTVGGDHFAIGGPGDEVVLGRWTCQPQRTVALLRAGTGSVWVFPTWPTRDHPVQAVAVSQVTGALRVRPSPAGRCDDLLVTRADGTTLKVRPRIAS